MRDLKNPMENSSEPNNNNNNYNNSKRTLRRSSNSHISMSDTDSTTSQPDSWHSPLRSESPLRSDDPYFQTQNTKSLVPVVDKYYTPLPSPGKPNFPASSQPPGGGGGGAGGKGWKPWPQSQKPNPENRDVCASPVVVGTNRLVRDEPVAVVKKVGSAAAAAAGSGGGGGVVEEGYVDELGGERRSRGAVLKRSGKSVGMRKCGLVLRLLEMIVCLVSFSVMAADRTQGWSGDSFDRYKEYKYCLAVNVIGFVYSAFQACDLACRLGSGNHVLSHRLRYQFEFTMDQLLAYFLVSASSSAATRVEDWISNWGTDEFTLMATASIAMSFVAFIAFALSSLVSGYNFCCRE